MQGAIRGNRVARVLGHAARAREVLTATHPMPKGLNICPKGPKGSPEVGAKHKCFGPLRDSMMGNEELTSGLPYQDQ